MNIKHSNYYEDYLPSKYAEDNLMVCDTLGNICSSSFHFDRTTFNNNVVIYVVDGIFHVEQYGKKISLKKGQGILLHLNDAHIYYTDKIHTANIIFFHFRGNISFPIISQLKTYQFLPLVFTSMAVEAQIYRCFDIMREKLPTFEFDLSVSMFEIIIEITKDCLLIIKKDGDAMPHSWFADSIIKYIDQNLYNKLSLTEMANYVNLSKYHFCRVFSESFNTTPMTYLTKKKIEESKRLLRTTHLKLSEISHELGFSDQSHFSKTFKSLEGISPLNYRKLVEHSYLSDSKSQT